MEVRQLELFIRRAGHAERRMVLPRGGATVGRAEDSDVVLSDVGVSRRHARIHVDRGAVKVEDCGSGNGTFLGTRKISTTSVGDGDEIRIDPFTLQFRVVTDAARPAAARMAPPQVARLEVTSRHAIGKGSFNLPGSGVLTLGRSEANDIVLPEVGASRHHAEIQGAGGVWVLRDSGSSNGTYLNDIRVSERRLEEGDIVRIGAVELRFTQTAAPLEAEFSDRTENFDAVLHGVPDSPNDVRVIPAAAKVPTRTSTAPTMVPLDAPPPPSRDTVKTMPPGALPAEMPFSNRSHLPTFTPTDDEPRARPTGFRNPLRNPAVQIAIGATVFLMLVIGLLVGKLAFDQVVAARRAAAVAVVPAQRTVEPVAVAAREVVAPAIPDAPLPVITPRTPVGGTTATLTTAGGSEAGGLVAQGQALFQEGRLFDAAALFYRALQLEPTNTSAEHWGFTACEFIVFDQMRLSMKVPAG